MTKDEALKLALEALQDYVDEYGPSSDDSGAQYVLKVGKEILAQPEQEPVAWQVKYRDDEGMPQIAWFPHPVHPKSPLAKRPYTEEPLYTTPPQRKWVGLAAEDRLTAKYMQGAPDGIEAVIDYIEAKLREKNGG